MNPVTIEVIVKAIRIRRRNAATFLELAPTHPPTDMLRDRAASLAREAQELEADLMRHIGEDLRGDVKRELGGMHIA